jgi:hypothetical protein
MKKLIIAALLLCTQVHADDYDNYGYYPGYLVWAYQNCKTNITRPVVVLYMKEATQRFPTDEEFYRLKVFQMEYLDRISKEIGMRTVCLVFEDSYFGGGL